MARPHRDFLPISLSVFALATFYGVINDQVIATISPQHFQLNFPALFPFENVHLQALCLSLALVGAPSLAWGILLYWVSHYGLGPVVGKRTTILGAAVVISLSAVLAWGLGWRESLAGQPPYPMFFFPSVDPKLYFTQTVQLTNYLVGFFGAAGWLLAIASWRQLQVKAPPEKT